MCFYMPPFPGIKSYYDMIDAAVKHNLTAVEGFCFFEFQNPDIEEAKKIREYADANKVLPNKEELFEKGGRYLS